MSAAPRDLLEEIKRYVPGIRADNSHHGIERLIILLLGFAGHGKSSLINSCMCVVKDDIYRNLAGAGEDEGGRTTKRTSHYLTNTICITDNRGFKNMKPGEILEVCAQQRHLRLEGDFDWERDNLQETIRCIPVVNKRLKEIILPVIVHRCPYNFKDDEENSMITVIKKCQEITGIPPIVVITNVGPPDTRFANSAAILTRFGQMGCTNKICLENYTENGPPRSQEADDQFLRFLKVCMDETEHAIRQRGRRDQLDIFTKNVADQLKEEKEENDRQVKMLKTELEESKKKVTELEESLRIEQAKSRNKRCSIL
ncbi:uncharacterized protein LOC120943127 [Rana temporaria]|uniref:uncharacterized protein LOC120943127 n=1 Tax=Rana temporaria TaxID=8407 RepID=UPI001AACDA7E|nr:uncharacterized protein LOC120943127 [Rana temporaria]